MNDDMRAAAQNNWIVDPGSGVSDASGHIVASATGAEVVPAEKSRTTAYLRESVTTPAAR